jgi:hypothetical protein
MCIDFHDVPAKGEPGMHVIRLLIPSVTEFSPSFDELMSPLARLDVVRTGEAGQMDAKSKRV